MVYQIASQRLRVHCPDAMRHTLTSLTSYAIDDTTENVIDVDLLRFRFPERMIPEHRADYSGFLSHKSSDPDQEAFIFCFRNGELLYGMQKEKDGTYNVYIHSKPSISIPPC